MMDPPLNALPITVILAVKNEAENLPRCLAALRPAARVLVVDSKSTDGSVEVAASHGADVVQFVYRGGYPKKRQWVLDNVPIHTPWVLLLDADEVVPEGLWKEIADVVSNPGPAAAYTITKGFHFLGRRFHHGGFSHSAVLLVRTGKARFERLFPDNAAGLDMEVHERVIVEGHVGHLLTPLIHEDFKGLEAYVDRHNKYSTWEARLRYGFLATGEYGEETIQARILGNSQQRRRALKKWIVRIPFEPWLWFAYHFIVRLGVLEGKRGLIACQMRMNYIAQVRAKVYELEVRNPAL